MRKTKPVKDDVAQKEFFQSRVHFADICNGVLYNGEQRIQESDLEELDSDASEIIQGKDGEVSLERRRDIIMKVKDGTIITIIGIENQANIHYAMPLRTLTYDVLGYIGEVRRIKKERRADKPKETEDEFLSGFGKEDTLKPIITITLYYGEKPWDGPTSFQEMLGDLPEELKKYVPNYELNIIELRGDKEYHFLNEEVRKLFEIARICLQGEKEELKKIEKISVSNELANILGTILRSEYIIQKSKEEGGEVQMCTLFDEMVREAEERGEEREHKKMCTLLDEMMEEAKKRGETSIKLESIIKQLKKNKETNAITDNGVQ